MAEKVNYTEVRNVEARGTMGEIKSLRDDVLFLCESGLGLCKKCQNIPACWRKKSLCDG